MSQTRSITNDQVTLAAHWLAVRLSEEKDLPLRYRRRSGAASKTIKKGKEDSGAEKRFKTLVNSWQRLILTILASIEEDQAWRFINLCPGVDGPINRVTENKDFCDLLDYLALRRDTHKCDPDELGGLALLSVAFQREVEKQIQA